MPQTSHSFNVADVVEVLQKQWKIIAFFVATVLVLTTALLIFVLPVYYKSTAIVVAANPELADKAHLFNNNIQTLYSNFGKEEDLDRIYGIANLDTTYKQLVDEFKLTNYYKDKGSFLRKRQYAVEKLKDDIQLIKTELYELRIIVYTKNKQLSADIANRMTEIIQATTQNIWQQTYKNELDRLKASINDLENQLSTISDSTAENRDNEMLKASKQAALLEQLKTYQKAANEYELAIANKTPALYILEKASPLVKVDKPQKLDVLVGAFVTSLAFAILAVLVYERKRSLA